MDSSNLNDYRVVDLKKELERRGLPRSGTKKELVDRLRAQLHIEHLHNKVTSSESDASSLKVAGDEENEFVKNYLEQRQKLLLQQMEQKKKFEEETSQMEDEEDSIIEAQNAQSDSFNQSDDETDVESTHDATEQQVQPTANNNDVELSVYGEPPAIASISDNADVGVEILSDVREAASSLRPKSLSRSRSASPDRQSGKSSRSSSRHRSRSISRDKSVDRSRSSSEDDSSPSDNKRTTERKASFEDNESSSDRKQTKERERSISQSSSKSRSLLSAVGELPNVEISNNESVTNDGKDESTSDNVVQHVDFSMNDSLPASMHGDLAPTEQISADASDLEIHFNYKEQKNSETPETETGNDTAKPAPIPIPETSETVKPARKRRWGSVTVPSVKPTINISTDSLRGLIPDIEAGSMSLETPMELDEGGDGLTKTEPTKAVETSSSLELSGRVVVLKNTESPEQSDTRAAKLRRTVLQEQTSTDVLQPKENRDIEEPMKDKEDSNSTSVDSDNSNVRVVKAPEVVQPLPTVSKTGEGSQKPRASRQVSLTIEDPIDVGRKSPSPSRHPLSNVVHVTGLVRPYTLGQLKELLGRTGNLQAEGFWIDNIKSHCYVVYETVDQAVATRKALHGKRWPASNPKLLGIEFRTFQEFEKRRNNTFTPFTPGELPPADKTHVAPHPQPAAAAEQKKETNSASDARKELLKPPRDSSKTSPRDGGKNKMAAGAPLREWDRHKLRQSRSLSREKRRNEDRARVETADKKESGRHEQQKSRDERRGRGRTDKPEVGAKVEEEPPAKLLDDLFRKTVAMPCIYWLPLTDEQANERLAQEKQEKLLRDQRRAERDQQIEEERQQRLKARDERAKQDAPRFGAVRDRQQPAQRRKFSESDVPSSRRRASSRSGGRANRK